MEFRIVCVTSHSKVVLVMVFKVARHRCEQQQQQQEQEEEQLQLKQQM